MQQNQHLQIGYKQSDSMFQRADTQEQFPPQLGLTKQNATLGGGMDAETLTIPKRTQGAPATRGGNINIQAPMMLGGSQKTVDTILQDMAIQISQQMGKIRTIDDFFLAYDSHQQRQFEKWEILIIFMDKVTNQDAETLFQAIGNRDATLSYQQLISSLSMKLPQLQPGSIARNSIFLSKPRGQQINHYLNQILEIFQNRRMSMSQGYDQFFSSAYINLQEFSRIFTQLGINIQQNDLSQVFQYFLIMNESLMSKICFVQALKQTQSTVQPQLQTIQSVGSQNTFGSSLGATGGNYNPCLEQVLAALTRQMSSSNLTFERLLQNFNINPADPYIESSRFEELCLRLSLMLQSNELQSVIRALDQDSNNKVKTQLLRRMVEEHQRSTIPNINAPALGYMNQQYDGTSPTINHSNSFHIQAQPIIGSLPNQAQNMNFNQNNNPSLGGQPQLGYGGHLENDRFGQFGSSANQQTNMNNPSSVLQLGYGSMNQTNQNINLNQNSGSLQLGYGGMNDSINQNTNLGYNQSQQNIALQQKVQLNPQDQLKPLYEKIRQFLQQLKIQNLRKLFSVSILQSKEVVELQEFLNFLQAPGLSINQNACYSLASQFVIQSKQYGQQTQQFIDLGEFEKQLYAGQQNMLNIYQQQHSSYETLTKIYNSIRKYIMMNGGDIWKFFSQADVNKDNFISKAELKIALEKIGYVGLNDQEINQIYMVFDANQDGRISYQEMCKQFAEFSNTKSIKDPSHWSFYIFENIRRRVALTQQSLASLFGLTDSKWTSYRESLSISKDQFFQALNRLNIPLNNDSEKKLLELLDADQQHQYQIDFIHFSELVGLSYQSDNIKIIAKEYMDHPLQVPQQNQLKKFNRQLYDVLQSKNITINNLTLIFSGIDLQKQGTVSINDFISLLNELDFEKKLDQNLTREIAQKFTTPGGMVPMFTYKKFLNTLEFEFEKFKIINCIFLTLQAAMTKLNLQNLQQLFQKFDSTGGMRSFDQTLLQQTLLNLGIGLNPHETQMVLLEYDSQGTGTKLDFALFDSDFREFCQGTSQLNSLVQRRNGQYNDFNKYLGQNKPYGAQQQPSPSIIQPLPQQPAMQRQLTSIIQSILRKIGNYLDSNPNIKFTQLLLEHDITKSGILSVSNFQSILHRGLELQGEEASHLVLHYDPQSRQQIKIQDFLTDITSYVNDVGQRLGIANVSSQLGQTNGVAVIGAHNPKLILQRFQKDFEEILKAIMIRKSDSYKWFQSYSSMPGRQSVSRNDFRSAISALNLSQLSAIEIDTIFDALDAKKFGQVEIIQIDEAIRGNSSLDNVQMQEELIDKIVRAFNGDDAFLLKELVALDKSGRGILDLPLFVNFFVRNAPNHIKFSQNDLQYLGMKYTNPNSMNPNMVDVNTFHNDFKRVRQAKGIPNGFYQGIHAMNQDATYGGGSSFGAQQQMELQYTSGHRNPLLPSFSNKNTRAEKVGRSNPNFRINLEQEYLEDLAKGTYVREKTVFEFFQAYAQRQTEILQETDFNRAVQNLQVNWTLKSTANVFNQIDTAFNSFTRKMMITPSEIDEAVAYGCKKGINLRAEIQQFDARMTKQVSIDSMKTILLNTLRVPQINDFDVVFLCKKYIMAVPNQMQYEKFLDDLEALNRANVSVVGNFKAICDYLRKGCLAQRATLEEHFNKSMHARDMITSAEFSQACMLLGLVPEICQANSFDQLFNEIDMSRLGKISLAQISNYVSKNSSKQTRELQDEILDEISVKVQAKSIMIDTLFKTDDVMNKGYVTLQSFCIILQRQFMIKEIDAKVITQRYLERGENVNYRMFLQDIHVKAKDVKSLKTGNTAPGLALNDTTNPLQQRLKQLLIRIQDFSIQNNLQLASVFSYYERGQSTGTIQQNVFIQALDQSNIPLSSDEKYFLSENYLVFKSQPPQVDYLKFLEDLKLHASAPAKSMQSLTKEQEALYNKMSSYLKKEHKVNIFAEAIIERDITTKGYLNRQAIEDVFKKNGLSLSALQFQTLFSALDQNRSGEFNYKQMFEIMIGHSDTQKLFSGASLDGSRQAQQTIQFVMPQQPIGASSAIMSQIGRKLIQSNINFEEEFKRKIGPQQAQSANPKANENEILDVFAKCGMQLTIDERTEFKAFINVKKDQNGFVSLLEFLQAIGLPAQTLGSKGQKTLPKRILQPNELNLAQGLVAKLRNQLSIMQKRPQDIFEKCKSSLQDLSIPMIKFKLTLASELGTIGQQVTDDQIALLTYYLSQEVPGEISYKKMYLAFTLTDKDPPLSQEGADEIRKYEQQLRKQANQGVPLEVIDLIHFMKTNQISMAQIFKQTQKGLISRQEFETSIKDVGFQAKDANKLIEILDVKGTRTSVSLDKLNEYIRKITQTAQMTPQMARDRYQGFDPKVRNYLQRISDYLKKNNITMQRMYEEIDVNKDGVVDKMEFVTRLQYLHIPGIELSDLGQIFDAIDINNDNTLSLNEFGMFIEGAKATKQQRLNELDPKLVQDMQNEIKSLFLQFDENGDGHVTADEIYKAMMALGQRISLEDAANMIKSVDQNGDGRIEQKEFIDLLLPKMKDDLMHQEDNLEDLRAMFLDADIDHSGTLSVDEIYSVLLKLGAEVSMEELIELMNEIDMDRNGQLDIDEFVALMNIGDEMQFRSPQSKNTLINIKRSRKLNPLDFFKCFKSMPMNFVPSFFTEKWVKSKKNLPSSVFMPQIDPTTMLYKDLFPVLSENIAPHQNLKAFQPRVRPLLTEIGCQILLEEGQGVPLPQSGQNFNPNQIVKRCVRIGLYDTVKKDFIINAVQVNALYNSSDEDIWKFNAWKDNGTNPVLFKTSNKDEIVKPHIFLIFELVIYVQGDQKDINKENKVTEISCGWCQLDLNMLDRPMTHKLAIKGGSPNAEMLIKDSDVHTNRTGVKYIMKVIQTKITSQLTVSIRPHTKFTDETKFHLDLLPSTCLIQKRLLYFVSGFRNYLGDKLLKESSMGTFRHPEGDVIISCFPKILDNPDICEQVINIWSEDIWPGLNAKAKMNVENIILKSKEFIQKLYPVLYADEFKFKESNTTMSASGDQYLMRKREELIKSALRFGNPQAKVKADKPVEMLTSFKPFTVRELEFEVWDTSKAKQDRYLKQYEDLGLMGGIQKPESQNYGGLRDIGQKSSLMGGSQNLMNENAFGNAYGNNQYPGGNVLQPLNNNNQPNNSMGGQPRSLFSAANQAFGQ